MRGREDENQGSEVEIEGFITEVISPTSFVLGGDIVVSITPETEFERGTIDDIAINVLVEVHGQINDFEVLVAEEIEF